MPDGLRIVRTITQKCGVLIENFRPNVAERLGLGYEERKNANRGLVYASINGFGADVPYMERPAYDHVMQALIGFMPKQGRNGAPEPIRNPVVDKVAAMSPALSSVAALRARTSRGGAGQKINLKMYDAKAASILPEQFINETFLDPQAPKMPEAEVHRVFATPNGHAMVL